MEIPVTQYLMPDGRKRETSIDGMPDSLAPILREIAKAGLHLEAEVLSTGMVSFTLAYHKQDTDYDIEICANGPGENGTKASLIRLIKRFDRKQFMKWAKEQNDADDGLGVGWGT